MRGYRVLARCALADDKALSAELSLLGAHSFVIRRDSLSQEGHHELANLVAAGWVRTHRFDREDIVAPTMPAVFAVELAEATAEELNRRANVDGAQAGVWLGRRLEAVNLGDLIGAEAICCLALKQGNFGVDIISGLLSVVPKKQVISNALCALKSADGTLIHLKVQDDHTWITDRSGQVQGEPMDLVPEPMCVYSDTTAWMILAQFARLPTAEIGDDNARMDPKVLFEIGQCPFPLVRTNKEPISFFEHDFGDLGRVTCSEMGAIEGVTQAMADFLSKSWAGTASFVDAVLKSGSLPLIHRLRIGLHLVCDRNIPTRSDWADTLLHDRVNPAISELLVGKLEDSTTPEA